jgi:hypothetical protein
MVGEWDDVQLARHQAASCGEDVFTGETGAFSLFEPFRLFFGMFSKNDFV